MADGKRLKNGFKGLMAQFDVDWTPKEVDQDGNVINPASFKFREDNLAIDRFKAVMDVGARPNRYEVTISCPKLGGIAIEGLRCIEASLPGRQLQTQDFSEYGATRKYPYQVQHHKEPLHRLLLLKLHTNRLYPLTRLWQLKLLLHCILTISYSHTLWSWSQA